MKTYRPHQFAEKLGVSVSTLRRWDFEGRLVAKRTKTNQRYYTDEDYRLWRNIPTIERKKIVYCRVSSAGQKEDLQSQISAMQTFCLGAGVAIDEWISEIGSGLLLCNRNELQCGKQRRRRVRGCLWSSGAMLGLCF